MNALSANRIVTISLCSVAAAVIAVLTSSGQLGVFLLGLVSGAILAGIAVYKFYDCFVMGGIMVPRLAQMRETCKALMAVHLNTLLTAINDELNVEGVSCYCQTDGMGVPSFKLSDGDKTVEVDPALIAGNQLGEAVRQAYRELRGIADNSDGSNNDENCSGI